MPALCLNTLNRSRRPILSIPTSVGAPMKKKASKLVCVHLHALLNKDLPLVGADNDSDLFLSVLFAMTSLASAVSHKMPVFKRSCVEWLCVRVSEVQTVSCKSNAMKSRMTEPTAKAEKLYMKIQVPADYSEDF